VSGKRNTKSETLIFVTWDVGRHGAWGMELKTKSKNN
jgi:hypothetical protein